MKQFLSLVLIAAAVYLVYLGSNKWREFREKQQAEERAWRGLPPVPQTPPKLPGMNPNYEESLEKSLAEAKAKGAGALRDWLRQYRPYVEDPRLADIELDYVLLVTRENLPEAKRVFAEVRRRIRPDSPVYPRVESLSKTYQ
jgi:hypothetical protein